MEQFLTDLRRDITAMSDILDQVDADWSATELATSGEMPIAFHQTTTAWLLRMRGQVTTLEHVHRILTSHLEESQEIESEFQRKTGRSL